MRHSSPLPALSLILLSFFLPTVPLSAQETDFAELFARFRHAAGFDHEYPREKVYLHLDNNAYFEGETLWFKAYVVRASSLLPTTLSRVLYVELLNADGTQLDRKQLRIDSLGQAHGEFKLDLPVRSGFHELRAYTREMVNWGTEACFSRVVPVFRKPYQTGDFSDLDIRRPEVPADLQPGHPRKFDFGRSTTRQLDFFPEGGQRAGGLEQRVAYKLTDGRGRAVSDSLFLYDDTNECIGSFVPVHAGTGFITLPASLRGGHVCVGTREKQSKPFALPAISPDIPYVLRADTDANGVRLLVSGGKSAIGLLGLAVTCRERVCYFDTLTVGAGTIELFLPATALHDGVNHIELFESSGRGLCSRAVWKNSGSRNLSLDVRQNATDYEAFSPVVIDMNLRTADGQPVQSVFSMSVRDDEGELTGNSATDTGTDMLLSSELKGYIEHPEYYFEADDRQHRLALDLLLAVQGWSASPFPQMCGYEPFRLLQPIEEKLTLNGRVLRNNNKEQPYPGLQLHIQMYSRAGAALKGTAITDSLGAFAFASNVDYVGDWIAQITTRNEDNKRKWSRVVLDRWFDIPPRKFAPAELDLQPRAQTATTSPTYRPATFAWKDTIPHLLSTTLSEAKVVTKGKYRGFTGNRYTYNGGEHSGLKHADIYYNIEREVEQLKDRGRAVGLIWDLLPELNESFFYNDADSSLLYKNRKVMIFTDNLPGADNGLWADEVKSVVVMTSPNSWRPFLPTSTRDSVPGDIEYAVFIYSRPDAYLFKTRRGTDKRLIQGYAVPGQFYHPDYRSADLPDPTDIRRTLYWNPCVTTDAAGHATAIFYGNARDRQRIRISARGITAGGGFISFEQ